MLALAKEINAAKKRGHDLKLTDDELAFYDALGANDSAVAVLSDAVLPQIARELTATIRSSVTIDWTVKERCAPSCAHWFVANFASTATHSTRRRKPSTR